MGPASGLDQGGQGLSRAADPSLNRVSGVVRRVYEASHNPLYRNSAYLMVNSGIGMVLGLLFWVAAARLYPAEEVGLASAMVASVGLIGSFSLLGLNVGVIRFLPAARDRKALVNTCYTSVGLSSLALAGVFVLGLPVWSPGLGVLRESPASVVAFSLLASAAALFTLQSQVFVSWRAARFTLATNALWAVLRLALLPLLVFLGAFGAFVAFGLGAAVALLVGVAVILPRLHPGYVFHPSFQRQDLREMLRFSLGNYLGDAVGTLPRTILPILVLNLLGGPSAAYFRMAYGLAIALYMIPGAIDLSLFAEGSHSPDKVREATIKAAKLMALLLLPAIAVMWVAGDRLLLLFGGEYSANGLLLLRLLAISAVFYAITDLFVVASRVALRVDRVIVVNSLGAVLVVGASYVLGRTMGLPGIGIGWLAGNGVVGLVAAFMLLRWLRASGRRGVQTRG